MPSVKYSIEEIPINSYTVLLNLTIRNLEKRDFGEYNCSSVNAIGKSEGLVRLQGRLSLNVKKFSVICYYFYGYNF